MFFLQENVWRGSTVQAREGLIFGGGGGGGGYKRTYFLVHVKRPITKGAGAYTRTFTTLV